MLIASFVLGGLSSVLSHNLEVLHDGLVELGVDKWTEWETKYNKSFKTYFEKSVTAYEKVPTVLTDQKLYLKKVYQETDLLYKDDEEHIIKSISTSSLDNIISISNYSWITGFGGIGKSTMLKYFLLSYLESSSESEKKIPIYIELRKYNLEKKERRGFLKFIYDEMRTLGFDIDYKYFELMAKKGRFIFLLDAFDEVSSEYFDITIHEINELISTFENNSYIVTSRNLPDDGYLENIVYFKKFETTGLNKEQAISFISKTEIFSYDVKQDFMKQLNETLYSSFNSLAQNPILLSLMYKIFQKSTHFPQKKAEFLLSTFNILYDEHDAKKIGRYQRDFKTKLTKNEFINIFSRICFISYFNYNGEKKSFSEDLLSSIIERSIVTITKKNINSKDLLYDLSVCLCLVYKEGNEWFFVHNIFQEFYSAYYLYTKVKPNTLIDFFTEQLLTDKNNNWRLMETTLTYFQELDEYYDKNSTEDMCIIPMLKKIETDEEFVDYETTYFTYFGFKLIDTSLRILLPTNKGNTHRFLSYLAQEIGPQKKQSVRVENTNQYWKEINNIKLDSSDLKAKLSKNRRQIIKIDTKDLKNTKYLYELYKQSYIKLGIDRLGGYLTESEALINELEEKEKKLLFNNM